MLLPLLGVQVQFVQEGVYLSIFYVIMGARWFLPQRCYVDVTFSSKIPRRRSSHLLSRYINRHLPACHLLNGFIGRNNVLTREGHHTSIGFLLSILRYLPRQVLINSLTARI